MFKALTDADKDRIIESGGFPVEEDWGRIRYNRIILKPTPRIKKLLKAHGYKTTKESGSRANWYMDFVLSEDIASTDNV